ncbi:MAG: hypothetical protein R3C16_00350 [Hyphomonadaceae bacterium]
MVIGCLAALTLGGCVSAPANAPEWFSERNEQAAGDYPSLREVPRGTSANTNAAYWDRVEAEVVAAGEAVRANPRSEPAPDTDPADFIEEAREDLEETRQAHTP